MNLADWLNMLIYGGIGIYNRNNAYEQPVFSKMSVQVKHLFIVVVPVLGGRTADVISITDL